MGVESVERGDVLVICPAGPMLNFETHHELRDSFHDAIEKAPKFILIDLENVDHVDSVALGDIILTRLKLRGKTDIHLCGLCKKVESIFRFARMDLIFSIHLDADEAMAALASPPQPSDTR